MFFPFSIAIVFLQQAECNVKGVLVSNPEVGINQYGLTDFGRQQAKEVCSCVDISFPLS